MAKIWANRLIAGTKKWEQVPSGRKAAVREELKTRVMAGEITEEQMAEIVESEA